MEIESTEEATCWFAVLPKNVKLVQNIYFKMAGIAACVPPIVWCGVMGTWLATLLSSPWSQHSALALLIHVQTAHLDIQSLWINF